MYLLICFYYIKSYVLYLYYYLAFQFKILYFYSEIHGLHYCFYKDVLLSINPIYFNYYFQFYLLQYQDLIPLLLIPKPFIFLLDKSNFSNHISFLLYFLHLHLLRVHYLLHFHQLIFLPNIILNDNYFLQIIIAIFIVVQLITVKLKCQMNHNLL